MNFTFRDIVWVAIIALVIVLLSRCHRNNSDELEQKIMQLQDRRHKDSMAHSSRVTLYEGKAVEAHAEANRLITSNKRLEQQLDTKSAAVLRLSAALRAANIPDTNVIGVGQEYLDYCDSLALESSYLAINFNNYKKNNSYILAAKSAEVGAKDSIIALERKAKSACKDDYNALMNYYRSANKQLKSRNEVYVGAELLGSERLLIQNVGVALTLKTKTNKLWQISGGLQNGGGYYGRINGNILIRLRKN